MELILNTQETYGTDVDYTAAVAAGAAWMRENHPGVLENIDWDQVEMDNPMRCVLAHISPNEYHTGLTTMTDYWIAQHGFMISDRDFACTGFTYENLRDLWVNEMSK